MMGIIANINRSPAWSLPFWLALPSLFACGADSQKPDPPAEPSDVYWSLTLNHQAITMGPRDTITIAATARNVAGDALAGLPTPTYVSRDVAKVVVTPEGLVRVLGSGFEPVWIVATLATGNVRHVDSLRVRSVDIDPPPVLTTFSIQPVPPDSAKRGYESDRNLGGPGFPPLPVHATDAGGTPLTDLMVSFRSLDPNVARIEETTGNIEGGSVGDVSFTASTTMFGVTKVDTLRYRIGWPVWAVVSGAPSSDTVFANVGVGAVVFFGMSRELVGEGVSFDFENADLTNVREASASVAFDALGFSFVYCLILQFDCSDNSGNMTITPPHQGAARTFTAPGTYIFHVRPYGVTGRINVIDER